MNNDVIITVTSSGVTLTVAEGQPGVGVPPGGNTGQVMVKLSDTDYDMGWATAGSVYEVDTGAGLTGGPITTTGTVSIDFNRDNTWYGSATFNGDFEIAGNSFNNSATLSAFNYQTNFYGATEQHGTVLIRPSDVAPVAGQVLGCIDTTGNITWITPNAGTVTSITAGTGLTGGTITSSGTIAANIATSGGGTASQLVGATDSRLSNARTPTTHAATHGILGSDPVTIAESQVTNLVSDLAGKVPTSRQVSAGAGLLGGGSLASDVSFEVLFGTLTDTVCAGNDSRLSNSRTPTGTAGGSLAGTYPNPTLGSKVVGISNINATGTPSASNYLRGDGAWATVSGGSGTVTSITPAGDNGSGTAITTSGTITIAGTTNEVTTSVTGTTVTVGLPDAITVLETNVDRYNFNTTPTATDAVGRMYWDATYGTPTIGLTSTVQQKIGHTLFKKARNGSNSITINKGDVVYISGSFSLTELKVELADADSVTTSADTIGVAAETIAPNTSGLIQTFGFLTGVTTNGYSGAEGTPLYLSSTAGQMQSTVPTQPKHGVRVAFLVKKAGGGAGSIFINVQNYQELNELSNVLIGTQAEQDLLSWDNTTLVWRNRTRSAAGVASTSTTISAGTGLTGGGDLSANRTLNVSLSSSSSFISSNVNLSTATWTDITSISLAAGTWLVMGTATMSRGSTGVRSFSAQIVIGSTTYASTTQGMASVSGNGLNLSCNAIITFGSTSTVKLQGTTNTTGSPVDFASATEINMGTSNATGLVAIRLA